MAERPRARALAAVAPLAGAVIGAAFFAWVAGARVLAPTEIGWTMKLDWRVHFLGWHLFRGEPWQWPPGVLHGYHAPGGSAIGFTDSIPLVALLLKPFAAWLPVAFQYLGGWMLACYALQGVFGVLLTRLWTSRVSLQLLAAALFVLMPTLLMRVGHPALCAHWLVLWALWLYLRDEPGRPAAIAPQGAVGLLAGLTHPYLAVMVLAVLAALAYRAGHSRYRSRQAAVAGLATALGAVVTGWWASGLFSVNGPSSLTSDGLGYYSMNLLAPLTPTGWSVVLPEWPMAAGGQAYEGFQYLGAGVLALLLAAAGLVARGRRPLPWRALGPLLLAVTACAVYALSPRVTLGSLVVVDYGGPWLEPVAAFRATGRFFWPAAYLLLASGIALVVTRLPAVGAVAVLVAAVALQAVDLHEAHAERRATSRDPVFHEWTMPLSSPFWSMTLPHYDHLVLVEPAQCGAAPVGFEAPAYLAGAYGLTINDGVVARHDESARVAYCDALARDLAAGRVDDRSVYLMRPRLAARFRANPVADVVCDEVDGIAACVTARSRAAWRSEAAAR